MKTWIRGAGAVTLVVAAFLSGCQKAPPPSLTVHVKAVTPGGEPVAGVAVEARGKAQGVTDATGQLSFPFTGEVGDELPVAAKLDRPGMQFKPWQQTLVIRKWDAARPDTLEYRLEARLEPVALSSRIELETGGAPSAGSEVKIDGKPAKVDPDGRVSVDLGAKLSRPAKVSVRLKDFEPFEESAELRAGETFVARLIKIGVIYGKVVAAYEAMGRLVPVPDAEVLLGGKPIGKTDKAGSLKYQAPDREATLEVRKGGFVPDPASAKAPARRAAQIVVPLVPREAPGYRIALLPPKSGTAGDSEVEAALPEIEDKLSDHLFSHECFQKAESQKAADAIVSVVASRAEGGLLLWVKVGWASGQPIGGFAETGKFSRVKALSEAVASKIVEVFPFEGHVVGFEDDRAVTSLGSGRDRGVKKGDGVALFRWDGKTPPKLAPLGRAVIKRVDADFSRVELQKGAQAPEVGDKAVLLPRAVEASFDSAVTFTVKAGKAGAERPFADVNVYRDGVWVGVTSATGEIQVPVASSEKHLFLFAKGGIKPYREEVKAGPAPAPRTILLPDVTARLKLESEPSGARVRMDDEELGLTPLDTDVLMGFHHVVVDAGGDWRAYDKVMEFKSTEEDYTGARRIVLPKDLLARSEALLQKGDTDGAIAVLSQVQAGHPDYSAAHHRLAGLYLDEKKDAAKAIQEYQRVLELPENRELVNKRFTVAFLNLGRAYYLLGTPEGWQKAIDPLTIARDNKRFFPKDEHDRATHDTLYFLALSSHKLSQSTGGEALLRETSARWKDYFDYYPASLQDDAEVKQARSSAEHYYEEIRRKLKEAE
jgi:tetratricopeptide repeat protein/PEGA domain-containing protein